MFDPPKRVRVRPPGLDEVSGIVQSRRHPGVFWVHNDSGDRARLFALRADGTTLTPEGIAITGARNVDWEDIALDGTMLFIADVGNNDNDRRDLSVYAIPEPDPRRDRRATAVARYRIAYPDQTAFPDPKRPHFDCEAVFVYRRRLHFLTKRRLPGEMGFPEDATALYRLDTFHADRVNVLRRLDFRSGLGGWVTGADVSPDGKTLAVLCHFPIASLWLFALGRTGDRLLSGSTRRLLLADAKQCEGVCFDGDEILWVANEQRDLFRCAVRDFVAASPTLREKS